MQLRPYQEETIFHLANSQLERECISLPTGGGKTFIFATFAAMQANEGKITVIVVNRIELLRQTQRCIEEVYGIRPVLLTSTSRALSIGKIYIAMVETLFRRKKYLDFFRAHADTLIVDECHIGSFNKVLHGFRRVIGFSATPIYVKKNDCLANYYHSLYEPTTISELVSCGYLVPPEYYVPAKPLLDRSSLQMNAARTDYDEGQMGQTLSKPKYTSVLVDYVRKLSTNRRAIIYNASIEHSLLVTAALRSAGFNAHHVDGTTPDEERRGILARLHTDDNCIVSNVNILTFGVDFPEVEAIFVNRCTMSIALYHQMCGRGSRPSTIIPKERFLIADMFGNNDMHGCWDHRVDWQKLFYKSKSETQGIAPMKSCPKCDRLLALSTMLCPECGYEFPIREEVEVVEIDPQLVRLEQAQRNLAVIMEKIKLNGNNIYRGLHLMKEDIFKNNPQLTLPELQALLLAVLPQWCKANNKQNNQWNRDFCNDEMKKYYESKRL